MQLKDLETIEARIAKMAKAIKVSGDKYAKERIDLAERIRATLLQGKSARTVEMTPVEKELAKDFFLLTSKPVVYVCNVDEASAKNGNKFTEAVKEAVKDEKAEVLIVAAATEADIADLESFEEKQMFLEELGLDEPGVNKLIHAAYRLLNLCTYFTVGVQEVRAWTFENGMKAPQTAGIIHSDFERGS